MLRLKSWYRLCLFNVDGYGQLDTAVFALSRHHLEECKSGFSRPWKQKSQKGDRRLLRHATGDMEFVSSRPRWLLQRRRMCWGKRRRKRMGRRRKGGGRMLRRGGGSFKGEGWVWEGRRQWTNGKWMCWTSISSRIRKRLVSRRKEDALEKEN